MFRMLILVTENELQITYRVKVTCPGRQQWDKYSESQALLLKDVIIVNLALIRPQAIDSF